MTCLDCNNSPCICSKAVTLPTYPEPIPCPEDHSQKFFSCLYSAAVQVSNDWNIPALNKNVTVNVPGIVNIPVGVYLFHSFYGYFHIVGFNPLTQTITLANENIKGTQPVGTYIPPRTNFILSDAPCCTDASNSPYPYVAEDFMTPANGDSLIITVTSVATLAVGDLIIIGNGTYYISAIPDGSHVEIRNQGDGANPQVQIVAKDIDGNLQYPLVHPAGGGSGSGCGNLVVVKAPMMVCDSGIQKVLDGESAGQVPFLQNAVTNEVQFQFPDAGVRLCVLLTSNLNLVNGTASYTINVASSVQFVVGEILTIGFDTRRYTITGKPTATQLTVTCVPTPTANALITAGSWVCKILSDELLTEQIAQTNQDIHNILDTPALCTTLTSAFSTVAGTSGYTLNVASSVGFDPGDRLIIGSATPSYFIVTNAPTAITLAGTWYPIPTASALVANSGDAVCRLFTTEVLQRNIDINNNINIQTQIALGGFAQTVYDHTSAVITPANAALGVTVFGNAAEILIRNESPDKNMLAHWTAVITFNATADNSDPPYTGQAQLGYEVGTSTGALGAAASPTLSAVGTKKVDIHAYAFLGNGDDDLVNFDGQITVSGTFTIAPSTEKRVKIRGSLKNRQSTQLGSGTNLINTTLNLAESYLAVAAWAVKGSVQTNLTAPLSIVSGTALYSSIDVASSAGFTVGDRLSMSDQPGYLQITSIPDGTNITGIFTPTPTANRTLINGGLVAKI